MNPCTTCGDSGKEKKRSLDAKRAEAKTKALEEKAPQAICREEIEGTLFIVPAATAFSNRFLIAEVVSGYES